MSGQVKALATRAHVASMDQVTSVASLLIPSNVNLVVHVLHAAVETCNTLERIVLTAEGLTSPIVACQRCLTQFESDAAATAAHACALSMGSPAMCTMDVSINAALELHPPSQSQSQSQSQSPLPVGDTHLTATHIVAAASSATAHKENRQYASGGGKRHWWSQESSLERGMLKKGQLLVVAPVVSLGTLLNDATLQAAFESVDVYIRLLADVHQRVSPLLLPAPASASGAGVVVPFQADGRVLTQAPNATGVSKCVLGRHSGYIVPDAAIIAAAEAGGAKVMVRVPMLACAACGLATCLAYGGLDTLERLVPDAVKRSDAMDVLEKVAPVQGWRAMLPLEHIRIRASVPAAVSCAADHHVACSSVPLAIHLRHETAVYEFASFDRHDVHTRKKNYIVYRKSTKSVQHVHRERRDFKMTLVIGALVTYRGLCGACQRLLPPTEHEVNFLGLLTIADSNQQLLAMQNKFTIACADMQ